MKIVVLGGGNSPERTISLRSAAAVTDSLRTAGFEVQQIDTAAGLSVLEDINHSCIVFPILHGAGGEDGTVQAELEKQAIPYLGTSSEASRTCFDKYLTREALKTKGLPVANGYLVTAGTYQSNKLRHQPHVIKAVGGGSSLGTLVVRDPDAFNIASLDEVFKVSEQAIVEELVEGTEVTIPILDDRALPVIEIQPPEAGEFDYENKYNGQTRELCPPVSLTELVQRRAQNLGEQVHNALGARHLSRVDMIIRPSGDPVILEINTIPGMTDQSLYPKSAAVAGITFPELMKEFVQLVVRDYKLQQV